MQFPTHGLTPCRETPGKAPHLAVRPAGCVARRQKTQKVLWHTLDDFVVLVLSAETDGKSLAGLLSLLVKRSSWNRLSKVVVALGPEGKACLDSGVVRFEIRFAAKLVKGAVISPKQSHAPQAGEGRVDKGSIAN